MNPSRPPKAFMIAFLAPAVLLFTCFVAWPCVQALVYSLQQWDGLRPPEWVGLANFVDVLSRDSLFWPALGHNLFLTAVAGALIVSLALIFAALLHRGIRGAAVFRVAFFFPNIIAAVAVALLWILLYSTAGFGLFNNGLEWLQTHLQARGVPWPGPELPFPFLSSQYLIYALVPMMVWAATGFYMVLFYAAMGSIPEEYYEAATLDGASGVRQFFHITLPLIREVITVGVVFLLISSLKLFDPIWVMENERPTKDSHVLATVLYQKVFTEYNIGYGAAVAVMLFLLVFTATLVSLRVSRGETVEY